MIRAVMVKHRHETRRQLRSARVSALSNEERAAEMRAAEARIAHERPERADAAASATPDTGTQPGRLPSEPDDPPRDARAT